MLALVAGVHERSSEDVRSIPSASSISVSPTAPVRTRPSRRMHHETVLGPWIGARWWLQPWVGRSRCSEPETYVKELLFQMDGRVNHMTWWLFALAVIGISVPAFIFLIIIALAAGGSSTNTILALNPIIEIVLAILGIFVNGKRFLDRNTSAWWVLIGFIPYLGRIWILVELGFLRGAPGENRFGPDSTGQTVARFAASA